MLFGLEAVQGDVAVYHGHSLCGTVYAVHMNRTAAKGVDGESARVAEKIQHVAPAGIAFHKGAVLALIEEEAGFLAFSPVYEELVTVLQNGSLPRLEAGSLPEITIHQFQASLEWRCSAAFVVDGLQLLSINLLESFADLALGAEHAHGMRLENAYAVIIVYYQAGQAVTFAMYQAIAVGEGGISQADRLAGPERCRKSFFPEGRSGGIPSERKDTHRDGTYLPVAGGKILSFRGINGHKIPFSGISDHLGNSPGENPGMEAADGFVTSSFQIYLFHSFPIFPSKPGAVAPEDTSPRA